MRVPAQRVEVVPHFLCSWVLLGPDAAVQARPTARAAAAAEAAADPPRAPTDPAGACAGLSFANVK